MIEVTQLTKYFDSFLAVDRISLHVKAGEVLALLGPNGAGKTTSVRMMTSILAPTSGQARLAGYDVVRQPEKVRANVGVLTEQHGLYERMKGLEYLDFFGEIYGLDRQMCQKRAMSLMERFGLGDAFDKRLGEYSKGMKQKLALLRAMLHNPPVLLLDEPTSAMDPESAKQVRDAIIEMRRDERTFLITTHNLTEAQLLADRIAIIRHGRIIANGTLDELAQQFVGQPVMELRINGDALQLQHALADLVNIESCDTRWLQYSTPEPNIINPRVLKRCHELEVEVVTLAQVTKNLEDIYLRIVREDEQKQNVPSN